MKRLLITLFLLFVVSSFDYTTTSTAFVDVDPTQMLLTMPAGQTCNVTLLGLARGESSLTLYFDLSLNGIRFGGVNGLAHFNLTRSDRAISFSVPIASPAGGVLRLQWKVNHGTAILRAGASLTGCTSALTKRFSPFVRIS